MVDLDSLYLIKDAVTYLNNSACCLLYSSNDLYALLLRSFFFYIKYLKIVDIVHVYIDFFMLCKLYIIHSHKNEIVMLTLFVQYFLSDLQ